MRKRPLRSLTCGLTKGAIFACLLLAVVSCSEKRSEDAIVNSGDNQSSKIEDLRSQEASTNDTLTGEPEDVVKQGAGSPPLIPSLAILDSDQNVATDPLVSDAVSSSKTTNEFPIRFTDVTATSGIDFVHTDGSSGMAYIVEGMASGIISFDYDEDGLFDIYFLNGAPLKGSETETVHRNRMYKNNGDWTFTDVTDVTGLGDTGFALGGTVGDYDGDGRMDVFVNNFGPNALYHNEGNGIFKNVAEQLGVTGGNKVGAGAVFFDKDGDGDLDLYVANYVDFTYENYVPIKMKGVLFQAGPQYYQPIPDALFENNGDGTFKDVTEASGIGGYSGPGMAVMAWDYDSDSDLDVFVCNDGKPNFLFQNDGKGNFKDVAVIAGLAYDFNGKANSSMGVDLGDYDGDGRLDLFVTDYQSELPVLYRSLPGGFYEDATTSARIDGDLFAHVHWGTSFADFDNDGHSDLFVACGHFDPIELIDDRTAKKVSNYLLRNQGNGTFQNVAQAAGTGFDVVESSRSIAVEDFDNDGDLDVIVLNSAAAPTLMRNDTNTEHHWLQIVPVSKSNQGLALGSQVKVVYEGGSQVAVMLGAHGYQSFFGNRLHFGLGSIGQVERVEIRWNNDTAEKFLVERVDQVVRLLEGTGTPL